MHSVRLCDPCRRLSCDIDVMEREQHVFQATQSNELENEFRLEDVSRQGRKQKRRSMIFAPCDGDDCNKVVSEEEIDAGLAVECTQRDCETHWVGQASFLVRYSTEIVPVSS